jgi:hypothetical protein
LKTSTVLADLQHVAAGWSSLVKVAFTDGECRWTDALESFVERDDMLFEVLCMLEEKYTGRGDLIVYRAINRQEIFNI